MMPFEVLIFMHDYWVLTIGLRLGKIPNFSFIHSGHFYSALSSPLGLLLKGAPDYSADTVSEFHAEAHRQL